MELRRDRVLCSRETGEGIGHDRYRPSQESVQCRTWTEHHGTVLHERRRNVRATALHVSEETDGGSTDAWKPSGIYRDRECPRSGYIDSSLFLRWMKLFVDTVGCTEENRHLLLLDSHKSLEVIIFARDNGVVMLSFLPHCTHRLQPLDRTSLRSLKAGYSRACDNWMTCHKGRPITQFDVIELFTNAYNTSATVASATNGFSAAGLWPFNDSKFDDELGNTDEAAQFAPVRNPVGDEDDMQAEPVVNDVVQRPIVHARTDDSVQETSGDTRSASTITVLADVHAMPVAVTINQDVLQPEPISSVTQRARAIAIRVADDDLERGRLVSTLLFKTMTPLYHFRSSMTNKTTRTRSEI